MLETAHTTHNIIFKFKTKESTTTFIRMVNKNEQNQHYSAHKIN